MKVKYILAALIFVLALAVSLWVVFGLNPVDNDYSIEVRREITVYTGQTARLSPVLYRGEKKESAQFIYEEHEDDGGGLTFKKDNTGEFTGEFTVATDTTRGRKRVLVTAKNTDASVEVCVNVVDELREIIRLELIVSSVTYGNSVKLRVNPYPKTAVLGDYMAAKDDCVAEAQIYDIEGKQLEKVSGEVTVDGNEISVPLYCIGKGKILITVKDGGRILYGGENGEKFTFEVSLNNPLVEEALFDSADSDFNGIAVPDELEQVEKLTLAPESGQLDLGDLTNFPSVKEIEIAGGTVVSVTDAPKNITYYVETNLINDYISTPEWAGMAENLYPSENPGKNKIWAIMHSEFSDEVFVESIPLNGLPDDLDDTDEFAFKGWVKSDDTGKMLTALKESSHVYALWTPTVEHPSSPVRWFTFEELPDGGAAVTGFTPVWENYIGSFDKSNLNFPAVTADGLQVCGIASEAFANNGIIEKIYFRKNIVSLGAGAFENCANLVSVEFDGSRTDNGLIIEDNAFNACVSLSAVIGGDNTISVGEDAFTGTVWYDTAPDSSYGGFKILGMVVVRFLPESVRDVTSDLFRDATVIAPKAFENYGAGEKDLILSLPNYITKIDRRAFLNAGFTSLIVAEDSVTDYDPAAFEGCINISDATVTTAVIPVLSKDGLKNVKIIGDGELRYGDFRGAELLEKADISFRISKIEGGVFVDCGNLSSLSITSAPADSVYYSAANCIIERATRTLVLGCKDSLIPQSGIVVDISSKAFAGCIGMTELFIPESVETVAEDSFEGCVNIGNAVLPSYAAGLIPFDSLKDVEIISGETIEGEVFANAPALEIVGLSDKVKSIGNKAFYNVKSLKEISLGAALTLIGEYAFAECSALSTVNGGDAVSEIGEWAFRNTTWFTGIKSGEFLTLGNVLVRYAADASGKLTGPFPEGITTIGSHAFEERTSQTYRLKELIIPEGITRIDAYAFENCAQLGKLTIPLSLTTFGESAFGNFKAMTELTLPAHAVNEIPKDIDSLRQVTINGETEIPSGAFASAGSLEILHISDGITEIGSGAFVSCTSLLKVYIPSSVSIFSENAFNGCDNISEATMPIAAIGVISLNGLTELELNGGTTVPEGAFAGARKLESANISDSVTQMGSSAFAGCSSLKELSLPFIGKNAAVPTVFGEETVLGYVFGVENFDGGIKAEQLCEKRNSILPIGNPFRKFNCYVPQSFKKVTVRGGNINFGAFSGFTELCEVVLPEGIQEIPDYTFYNCKNLETSNLTGVTNIGKYAFYGCEALNEVNLESVQAIDNWAFAHTGLGETEISNVTERIGDSAFLNSSATLFIEFAQQPTAWNSTWNASDCTAVWNYADNRGVTADGIRWAETAGDCAVIYGYEGSGGKVTLPESVSYEDRTLKVTEIANYGFTAPAVTELTVPQEIVRIGRGAFSGCSQLNILNIPYLGESFGLSEASGKSLLGYIFGIKEYDGGIETIQYYADGENLTYYIPSALTKVKVEGGEVYFGAFSDCKNLIEIVLPEALTAIPERLFDGCSALKTVEIPRGVTTVGNFAFRACGIDGITVPAAVISIGTEAFSGCEQLKRVDITDLESWINIRFSGGMANPLYYAGNLYVDGEILTDLIVPDNILSLGGWTFVNVVCLKSVTLHENIAGVDREAFDGCVNIESISTVAEFVGTFPKNSLKYATVTNGELKDENTFAGADKLIRADLKGVTFISEGTFERCASIIQITLDCNALNFSLGKLFGTSEYADSYAAEQGGEIYYLPVSLNKITVAGGEISDHAFENMKELASVTLSDVTGIGNRAFAGCADLTAIVIPSTVRSIGDGAFKDCSFTETVIPFEVRQMGAGAFTNNAGSVLFVEGSFNQVWVNWYDGNGRVIWNYGGERGETAEGFEWAALRDGAAAVYGYNGSRNEINIPEFINGRKVNVISENGFYGLNTISKIEIGLHVTEIQSDAFKNCECVIYAFVWSKPSGWKANWNPDNLTVIWNYSGRRGVNDGYDWAALNDDTSAILKYYGKPDYGILEIDRAGGLPVSKIMRSAFEGLENVNAIFLAESIYYAGANAFKNCGGATIFAVTSGMPQADFYWNPDPCPVVWNYGGKRGCTDDGFEWVLLSSNSCGILRYIGQSRFVEIPEQIEGNPVTVIFGGEFGAFRGSAELLGVTLPSSLTEIKTGAYDNCPRIAEVINKSDLDIVAGSPDHGGVALAAEGVHSGETRLKTVDDYVFYDGGDEVYLVAYIGKDTVITLPENYEGRSYIVRENAFCTTDDITDITVPGSVEKIERGAFYFCNSLINLTLPFVGETKLSSAAEADDTMTLKHVFAYTGENGQTEYNIPDTLRKITVSDGYLQKGAFKNLSKVKEIVLPENLEVISEDMFSGCINLTSLVIPDKVAEIGKNAFFCCFKLETINIPSSVKKLDTDAFKISALGNYGLRQVDITDISAWLSISFANAAANPLHHAGRLYVNGELFEELEITELQNKIPDYAFYNATCLKSVTIRFGNVQIGENSFIGCTSISDIDIDTKYIPTVVGDRVANLETVVLSGSTPLAANAFKAARKLMTVELNAGITAIGADAFDGCVALRKVRTENLLNWVKIAFETDKSNPLFYAHNLVRYDGSLITTVGIMSSDPVEIKQHAFVNATCLKTINIFDNMTVAKGAFKGCDQINYASMCSKHISNVLSDILSNLTYFKLESGNEFPDNAFKGAAKLTTVKNAPKIIGAGAFAGCASLKVFDSCGDVQQIGAGALENTAWYRSFTSGVLSLGHVIVRYKTNAVIDLDNKDSYKALNGGINVTAVYENAFNEAVINRLNVLPTTEMTYNKGAFNGSIVDVLTMRSFNRAEGSNSVLSTLFNHNGNINVIQYSSAATETELIMDGKGLTAGTINASGRNLVTVKIAGFENVNKIDLSKNALTKVTLSNVGHVGELCLNDNKLASLDINGVLITKLILSANNFKTLDLTLIRAKWISLNKNDITSLTCSEINEDINYLHMPLESGRGGRLTSVEFAANLPNLRSLDIANNNVSNISPLIALQNITELYLGGNPALRNAQQMSLLNGASFLPRLTRLNIGDSNQTATALQIVKKSVNLKWLQIYNIGASAQQITGVISQATHKNLSYLKLSHNGFTTVPASLGYIGTVVIGYDDNRQD